MKKANIKTAMLLLVAAMTTAACSSSNDAGDTASTVLPVSVTATVADMQTRATNITTDNLANFGLYINPDVSATTWSSSQVTKASESWTLATPITWDTEKTASVAAYAPYQSTSTSPITVPTTAGGAPTMALTANKTAGNEPIDWLYNYQASYTPQAGTPLSITFHHAMSRLRVKVSLNDELSGATVTQVYIGNLHAGGTLNMADGTITYSSTPDYDPIYATNKDESATNIYSAFLVPQTVTSSTSKLRIKVTLSNGKSYTYEYPNDFTFAIGTAYAITLALGKDQVEASAITITPWTSETAVTGNATSVVLPSVTSAAAGMFVYYAESDASNVTNAKLSSENNWTIENAWWKSQDATPHIVIYSPYDAAATYGGILALSNGTDYCYALLNADGTKKVSDMLTGNILTVAKTDYKHLMAHLTIDFGALSPTAVTLNEVYTAATLTMSTGAVALSGTTSSPALTLSGSKCDLYVVPQTISAGHLVFTATIGGKAYTYWADTSEAGLTFTAGEHLTLNMSIASAAKAALATRAVHADNPILTAKITKNTSYK